MILLVHAAIGGSIGRLLPQNPIATPIAAFVLGFASHFVLDAIPHWHYHLRSTVNQGADDLETDMKIGKEFLFDLLQIGIDVNLGFLLLFFVYLRNHPFGPLWYSVLAGGAGGVLPDALQFVYFKTRSPLLLPLQRFHLWIHTDNYLDDKSFMGISSLVLITAASIAATLHFSGL